MFFFIRPQGGLAAVISAHNVLKSDQGDTVRKPLKQDGGTTFCPELTPVDALLIAIAGVCEHALRPCARSGADPVSIANAGKAPVERSIFVRTRPGYPADALRSIETEIRQSVTDITNGSNLLVDLGCGTGKFTREILPFARSEGLSVVGIEPVEAMRKQFEEAIPGVEVKDGTGDNIPIPDRSAQAVIAPQSFHWMSTPETLREVHRVLVPGGIFALVWNTRDGSKTWVRGLEDIIDSFYGDGVPRQQRRTWKDCFQDFEKRSGRGNGPRKFFSELMEQHFEQSHWLTQDELDGLLRSISVISTRPESEQLDASRRVRELIETHPDTRDKVHTSGKVELFYDTEVYWCRKLQ